MSARFVLLAAMSLLVAACNRNPLEVVVSRCPAVAVVGDVGTLTRFKGEGRESKDVAFVATIQDVMSDCTEEESVVSTVSFNITARTGDAFAGREVTLPYFVAILKDNSRIVTKEIYEVTLRFDANGMARVRETVSQTVPTVEQARRYNYEVLVGFQMTPEEAYYNIVR